MRVVIEVPRSQAPLAVIRRLARAWGEAVGAPADELPLVVTELVTNARNAASDDGEIILRLEYELPTVCVTVIDDGPGFDLVDLDPPPPEALRGRGLPLVRAAMDELQVERIDGHTVVTARKQVEAVVGSRA